MARSCDECWGGTRIQRVDALNRNNTLHYSLLPLSISHLSHYLPVTLYLCLPASSDCVRMYLVRLYVSCWLFRRLRLRRIRIRIRYRHPSSDTEHSPALHTHTTQHNTYSVQQPTNTVHDEQVKCASCAVCGSVLTSVRLSDGDGCSNEEAESWSTSALLAMPATATAAVAATAAVLALPTTGRYGQWYGRYGGQADVGTERADWEGCFTTAAVSEAEGGGAGTELSDVEHGLLVHVGEGRGRHVGLGEGESEGEAEGEEEREEEGARHGCVVNVGVESRLVGSSDRAGCRLDSSGQQ